MSTKKCYVCCETKDKSEFFFDNKEKTKLQSKCKSCHNKLKKKTRSKPILRIIQNQKRRVRMLCTNKGFKKTVNFDLIFGIDRDGFKTYLENLFYGEITWENYPDKIWEVDHIVPLSSVETFDDVIKLCHYSNLQPLLIEDHKKKTRPPSKIEPKI